MRFYFYLKNLRLVDVIGFIPITIITFIFGSKILGLIYNIETVFFVILLMFIYLIFSLSINNYFDRDNDKNSTKIKKNPISSGHISKNEGLAISIFVALFGLITCVYAFQNYIVYLYFIFLLNAFLYSWKFKGTPIVDLISHGIYMLALFTIPALMPINSSRVIPGLRGIPLVITTTSLLAVFV